MCDVIFKDIHFEGECRKLNVNWQTQIKSSYLKFVHVENKFTAAS